MTHDERVTVSLRDGESLADYAFRVTAERDRLQGLSGRLERERDAARAELARLQEIGYRGCECAMDDACAFARERDEARAETVRWREWVRLFDADAEDCPVCGVHLMADGYFHGDHAPDCPLAAALEDR